MINAMDQKLKNVQCFTGNQLKLIACLCMFIDHVSKIPMSKYMDKLFSLSLEGMISEEQFFCTSGFPKTGSIWYRYHRFSFVLLFISRRISVY